MSPVAFSSPAGSVAKMNVTDEPIRREHVSNSSLMSNHVSEASTFVLSDTVINVSREISNIQQKRQLLLSSGAPSSTEGSALLDNSRTPTPPTLTKVSLGSFKMTLIKKEIEELQKKNGTTVEDSLGEEEKGKLLQLALKEEGESPPADNLRSYIFNIENHNEIAKLMLQAASSLLKNPSGKYRFLLTNERDSITTDLRLRQRNFCAKYFSIQSSRLLWEGIEVVCKEALPMSSKTLRLF